MAKDLIIIGAAQDGRVAAEVVEDIGNEWNLLGYLDDDPAKQGIEMNGFPVLGEIADAAKYRNCYFVIMLGSPKRNTTKRRIAAKLGIGLEHYATLIHPNANVSRYTDMGRDIVITSGVTILPNCKIGNHVYILPNSFVGNETDIGDYVIISTAAIVVGEQVVKEGAYIGANSTLREHVAVGEWSIVGMGSVVVSDVPAYHVVAGNPARMLRKLEPAEFQL